MSSAGASVPVVRWAEDADLPAARACYVRNGYGGGVKAGDDVLVAERDGQVVGVVRLVDEEGHHVLRGLFLDAAERRQGLGTRMLHAIAERVRSEPCWLVCGRHLVGFYDRAGYRLAPESDTPAHLQARAIQYARAHGPQVVLRRP